MTDDIREPVKMNISKVRVNVGCGEDIQKSSSDNLWFNLDKCQEPGVDVIRDIEKQCLPFSDSTVDHILCGHTLEHIDDIFYVFNEFWRVLKPGGTLHISVPYGFKENWQHMTHKRIFYPQSWGYLDSKDTIYRHMRKTEGIKADFNIKVSKKTEDGYNLWTEMEARKELPENFKPILPNDGLAVPHVNPSSIKLDIGCGQNKRQDNSNWIGVDMDSKSSADIICNIEKGLPFWDKSVDFIYTSHTLEHISDLIGVMDEVWRVLKKDGLVEIIVPNFESADALRHPDHKRFMHKDLWAFWDPDIHQDDRDSYGVEARFKIAKDGHGKTLNYIYKNGLFTTLLKMEK